MSRSSVRLRITLGASLILVFTLAIAAFAAAGLVRRSLAADAGTELADRVDEVATLIQYNSLTEILDPAAHEVGQVQVVDAAGGIVAATPGFASTARLDVIPAPAIGEQSTSTVSGSAINQDSGQDFRVVARTVMAPTGPVTIYAATSLKAAFQAERYLRNSMLTGLPILILVAAGLVYLAMGRALAPVVAMRIAVDKIEPTDLSSRITAGASDNEIANLGNTLNRMLDRLSDAADRQELFAASASHELRSPLSAIRTELEVGLHYAGTADWVTIARESMIEVERLESLARDLRILTRTHTASTPSVQRIDLAAAVADELAKRRPPASVRYRTDLGDATVMSDRDAVVRVLRNLLENAERHARTEISITTAAGRNDVTLTVANDGEPVPFDERERIFEPFTRLEEARSVDTGGSGLGLAIARGIMRANGGSLALVSSDAGAAFAVRFPVFPLSVDANGGQAPSLPI